MATVTDTILSNLQTLRSRLPSVRDGDTEAIHEARVATRRLRAALPLFGAGRATDAADNASPALKAIGRALGRARDHDEALRLLDEIERRSPATAPAAAALRARLLPDQLRRRRRLLKTLEATDFEDIDHLEHAIQSLAGRSRRWFRPAPAWRSIVAATICACAARVAEKVHHASGVYFPNRAHGVRVAIKKLRYAAELIDGGDPVRRPALRALRTAQDTLGQVHDREVLLRTLLTLADEEPIPDARELTRVLEAECRTLFERYRAVRPAVMAACDDLAAWSRRIGAAPARPRLLVVGALALPPAAFLVASRVRRAG